MPQCLTRCLALVSLLTVFALSASAQTFTTISALGPSTGEYPQSSLVQGFDGNLYGTANSSGTYGAGTFFQVTPAGALTALYNFCYNDNTGCPDGAYPSGSIALGTDGNFYGTTQGSFTGSAGNGTAYKITPSGSMTVLHTFCALFNCGDGIYPSLGLTLARNGNLYGVTNAPDGSSNYESVVFEMSTSGSLHPLITVCPGYVCPADAGPIGSLLLSTGGSLISPGPSANYTYALYSMTPSGTPALLYTFCDDSTCHDGTNYIPSPLVESASSAIYGTFTGGGSGAYCTASVGCGTAFRVVTTHGGSINKLHDFCSLASCADGYSPGALILATDGNFYGVTSDGGAHNFGTLFRITSTGRFSVVHSFSSSQGSNVRGTALLQATDGNLYGANSLSIYRVSLGLAPFVRTVQNAGAAGANVIILGNNLTGTTSVTFNGVSASFTVVSSTEITATVPSGATTGNIKVVTPASTLNSNVAFQVLP